MLFSQAISPKLFNSSFRNPEEWLVNPSGGGTHANVPVDEKGALAFSAVHRAVSLISNSLSSYPIHVMQLKGEDLQPDKEHAAWNLLNEEPNELMNSFTFRQTLWAHVLLWGNGYARIKHDVFRNPVELEIIKPWQVTVEKVNGSKIYRIQGEGSIVTDDKMIHIHGLALNGLCGLSPIQHAAKQAVGLAFATEKFQSAFVGKGVHTGGTMQLPEGQFLDDVNEEGATRIDILTKSFRSTYGGLDNIGKVVFSEDGMTYTPHTMMPLQDAEILLTRNFQVKEIARFYGVPAVLLMSDEQLADQKVETLTTVFRETGVLPWAIAAEKEFKRKLFTEPEKARYSVKHNLDAVVRVALKERYEAHAIALGSKSVGFKTPAEVRALENLPKIDESELPKPKNMETPKDEAA